MSSEKTPNAAPVHGMVRPVVVRVVFKGGGKLWDEYVAAGGSMTFRAQLGREKLDIPGIVPELQALADDMGWIGETSEKWTRLAVFKRKNQSLQHDKS